MNLNLGFFSSRFTSTEPESGC